MQKIRKTLAFFEKGVIKKINIFTMMAVSVFFI